MSATSRRSSSASSSEFARQRDLNKYYQPWLNSKKHRTVPVDNGQPSGVGAQCSFDNTLTALAQLAALRLNVKRGMVSLLETKTQIVLAEATQTVSLVDGTRHAPGDHICLGNVSLPRPDCIDEHTFGAITTCKGPDGEDVDLYALVVNDASVDERFKDRSYVTAAGGISFYAGVPIVTKQGHAIGVYAVSDSKPRPQGVTMDEIQFMQNVAEIIAEHLNRVADAVGRVSERDFMKGITYFLEDLSEFKYKLSNSESHSGVPRAQTETDVTACDPQDAPPRGRQTQSNSPTLSKSGSKSPVEDKHPIDQKLTADIDVQPRFSRVSELRGKEGPEPSENNMRRIFTQASQLLCEQAQATGCMFVDAASGVFSGPTDQGSTPPSSTGTNVDLDLEFDITEGHHFDSNSGSVDDGTPNVPNLSADDSLSHMAQVLSLTLADDDGTVSDQGMVQRRNLKKCIQRYPFGKCFYLNKGRVVADHNLQLDEEPSGTGTDEVMSRYLQYGKKLPPEVLARLPNAKWLIFLPLFNYAHSQWFAAGFIWGNNFKMGDPDEALPYFKTFGSCMMSEVASMEVLSTNIAKSTFIASVSHDLRSPLHGMLGSLEFLEDTVTSAYQTSLVSAMETCGKTLLDTIDHLLDYAKINNLNRASLAPSSGRKKSGPPSFTGLAGRERYGSSYFDFSLLLEEVVEAVFAGQTFRKINLRSYDPVEKISAGMDAMSLDNTTPAEEQIQAGSAKFSGKVFLALNIEKSTFWCVEGQAGALRRVIMNVVGNAIKYCKSGCIEISAQVEQRGLSDVEINFAVKDTGIGISEEFMTNHLYKAFTQEDSFSPGTGLGLSITSQIVENLDGRLKIHSEKGVGTHVHIKMPMRLAPPNTCHESQETTLLEVVKVAKGKKVCILNPDIQVQGDSERDPQSKLETSLLSFCEEWFDMEYTRSNQFGDNDGTSIYIFAEPPPIEYLVEQHRERMAVGKTSKEAALLIICTNAFEAAALRAAGVNHLVSLGKIIEVISQPVGLRKLAKVMLQCLKRVEQSWLDEHEHEHEVIQSRPASPAFPSRDIRERATEVRVNTLPGISGESVLQLRPSLESMQWKSDEPRRKMTYIDAAAKGSVSTLGDVQPGEKPNQEISRGGLPKEETQSPPRVLLVDDNSINLKLLVTFVKKIKLPYAEAVNGLEAFTKFQEAEQPFDYVLMDLQMPIMDGFEATRKIRQYEQEKGVARAAIIIAITGVGNEHARKEAVEAGMSRYITKPVKFKELQQLLVKE